MQAQARSAGFFISRQSTQASIGTATSRMRPSQDEHTEPAARESSCLSARKTEPSRSLPPGGRRLQDEHAGPAQARMSMQSRRRGSRGRPWSTRGDEVGGKRKRNNRERLEGSGFGPGMAVFNNVRQMSICKGVSSYHSVYSFVFILTCLSDHQCFICCPKDIHKHMHYGC
jgi:hypothetical protein